MIRKLTFEQKGQCAVSFKYLFIVLIFLKAMIEIFGMKTIKDAAVS